MLLKWPDDMGTKRYPLMAPILYPDPTKKRASSLFKTPLIIIVSHLVTILCYESYILVFQVLRVILFSRVELKGAPQNGTMGKKWNVRAVNASMVSFAAIVVCSLSSTLAAYHFTYDSLDSYDIFLPAILP